MARRPRPPEHAPISRAQVLQHLRENPRADKRTIAHAFGLKGGERIVLKAILRELAAEGLFAPDARRAAVDPLDAEVVVAIIDAVDLESGEATGRLAEWLRPGPPPHLRLDRRDSGGLERGNRVLVRIGHRDGRTWRARLVRRAPDLPARIVGIVRRSAIGRIIEPVDKKLRLDFFIEADDPAIADGELVAAVPLAVRRFERPRARVIERLGAADGPRAASAIAVALHDIPVVFAGPALDEAQSATPAPLGDREDLRGLPLVTIDGEDARDFDDAVYAEPDGDVPGGFRLVVAIADVAWYVRPDGPLDREARRRGNSVYFPDRVVPMLPERLSNDLCSLRPEQDRPVLVADLRIDPHGQLRGHRFVRAMMRSAARLTYERVQAWADGDRGTLPAALHGPAEALFGAFRRLAEARTRRGTLDLDLPERQVRLDGAGNVVGIEPRQRLDAHRLIEEFMILANVAAAETLERRQRGCLYRVHDQPSPERIDGLREALATLGYRLARGQVVRPSLLAQVLAWAADKPSSAMVSDLVLRSQALAVYSPDNLGHFGLALPRYAHFTSPIRRYADLVVHRALIDALGLGDGGRTLPHPELVALGEEVSRAERRAQAAERAAYERYVAGYLAEARGGTFRARISGVHRAGVFVSLDDTGADGLIPMSTLPGRGWRVHPAGHLLEGPRRLAIGDTVMVRLVDVTPVTGGLRLELLPTAAPGGAHGAGPSRSTKRQVRAKGRRRT
ncbi:MAG: VacB/RNase II family 3'-5' exoribonuclease [Alphaproteobacteria bacterium]|nr:VacB/RNase II family 3'-5' exoribonuclease [Alphaproteobacteria bacterium]